MSDNSIYINGDNGLDKYVAMSYPTPKHGDS